MLTMITMTMTMSGNAGTEMLVTISSALSKNGLFYVLPSLSAEDAYMVSRISDRIRYHIHL